MRAFIDARVRPRVRVRSTDGRALGGLLAEHGIEAVEGEDGLWTALDARLEDIGRLTSAARLPILELAAEEATLEQAYLDLTATETEFAAAPTLPQEA
jgi:ABC-2 type transport system ATP-binding protein